MAMEASFSCLMAETGHGTGIHGGGFSQITNTIAILAFA